MKESCINNRNNWTRWFLFSRAFIKKGLWVHGIKRRASSINTDRIDHLYKDPQIENKKFNLHYGDLTDSFKSY